MPYVYSTATRSTNFNVFAPLTEEQQIQKKNGGVIVPTILRTITVSGGHGLRTPNKIIAPQGVATHVNDEDLAFLKTDPSFKRMVEDGFLVIDEGSQCAVEKAVQDLKAKDGSAQLTEADFSKPGAPAKVADISKGVARGKMV